jgi:hypothetical protein
MEQQEGVVQVGQHSFQGAGAAVATATAHVELTAPPRMGQLSKLTCEVLASQRDRPLGSEPWFNPEAVTEQKVSAKHSNRAVAQPQHKQGGDVTVAAKEPEGQLQNRDQAEHTVRLERGRHLPVVVLTCRGNGSSSSRRRRACRRSHGLSTSMRTSLLW